MGIYVCRDMYVEIHIIMCIYAYSSTHTHVHIGQQHCPGQQTVAYGWVGAHGMMPHEHPSSHLSISRDV